MILRTETETISWDAIKGLVRTMRPHQWIKNLVVLAPLVFAKELFDTRVALRAWGGFLVFCAAASTIYILNDLVDLEADRHHPIKKNRPLASGIVPRKLAMFAMALFASGGLLSAYLLSPWFAAAVFAYFVLNVAYSLRLKRIAYVDVLCIVAGFELRVVGGAFAAMVPISTYLIVVMFLLASFLGFGKRMHELVQGEQAHKQRAVLSDYHAPTLDILLWITAAATIVSYVVYTVDAKTRSAFGTDYLVITTPFTMFGVLRFLHLVRSRPESESPTDEMLRDKAFVGNLVAWVCAVIVVIYFGGQK